MNSSSIATFICGAATPVSACSSLRVWSRSLGSGSGSGRQLGLGRLHVAVPVPVPVRNGNVYGQNLDVGSTLYQQTPSSAASPLRRRRSYQTPASERNRLSLSLGGYSHKVIVRRYLSTTATCTTKAATTTTAAAARSYTPSRAVVNDATPTGTYTGRPTREQNLEFLQAFEEVESSYEPRDAAEGSKGSQGSLLSVTGTGSGSGSGRIEYTVLRRRSDGSEIASVRIANPTRANSVGSVLLRGLTSVLCKLAAREDLRVVEVTGAPPSPSPSPDPSTSTSNPTSTSTSTRGGHRGGGAASGAGTGTGTGTGNSVPKFCAGADLREMHGLAGPLEAREFITSVRDACQALRDVPVPTVAKIDGATLGAGLELAASCDFRVATRRSVFAMPEVKVGIPSVVHARLLANVVGWQRTREMVYLGLSVDGDTAAQWGLVDRLVGGRGTPEQEGQLLDDACLAIVRAAVENGPRATRAQKRLVRVWEERSLTEGVEAGVDEFANMWTRDGGEEVRTYMGRVLARNKTKER